MKYLILKINDLQFENKTMRIINNIITHTTRIIWWICNSLFSGFKISKIYAIGKSGTIYHDFEFVTSET